MYTKVLSTTLPDIKGYPNLYCGNTSEEWINIVENNYEINKFDADNFIDNNSWHSRVSEIINNIYKEKIIQYLMTNYQL